MTGWRCAAILGNADAVASYWRLKTNVDSGLFEAVQLAGRRGARGPARPVEEMNAIYARRRDLVVGALREIGVEVDAAEGDDLRLGAGARGPHLDLVRRARARAGGGGGLARLDVRAQRRGLLPDLADDARRAPRRGGRAAARAPRLRWRGRRRRGSSDSELERRYGYSRAVAIGDRVIVAGTAPVWPDGCCDPDPGAQARRCCEIIVAALERARRERRRRRPHADVRHGRRRSRTRSARSTASSSARRRRRRRWSSSPGCSTRAGWSRSRPRRTGAAIVRSC